MELTEREKAACADARVSEADFAALKAEKAAARAKRAPSPAGTISRDEARICERTGVSESEFIAARDARRPAATPTPVVAPTQSAHRPAAQTGAAPLLNPTPKCGACGAPFHYGYSARTHRCPGRAA